MHDRETTDFAAALLRRTVWAEQCLSRPLVLHADNDSRMKVTMERLGIIASFSRPRMSNDNPFSKALFRTCKHVPGWPPRSFASIAAARDWVQVFVVWDNTEHRHSAIRFVTPDQRHRGQEATVLAAHPERWSGKTRQWTPIGSVWLNPERP